MSDYNVTVKNVDSAMDMLESYSKEANDVRAHILPFCRCGTENR